MFFFFLIPNSAKVIPTIYKIEPPDEIITKHLQWVTTVSLNATTEVILTIWYKDEKQPNHILHI